MLFVLDDVAKSEVWRTVLVCSALTIRCDWVVVWSILSTNTDVIRVTMWGWIALNSNVVVVARARTNANRVSVLATLTTNTEAVVVTTRTINTSGLVVEVLYCIRLVIVGVGSSTTIKTLILVTVTTTVSSINVLVTMVTTAISITIVTVWTT